MCSNWVLVDILATWLDRPHAQYTNMQVSTANNVKVYNLSAGKSLPEWISDRKKRTLLKNDVGE